MAIRLIIGRLQQRSRNCAKNNNFKSGVHERRWPTQAQLMRSDILRNIDVLGRECLWSLVPLSPRGRWVSMPVSGFSVSYSASPLV